MLPALITVCLAALLNWLCWSGLVLLGFGAMLHTSFEMLALTRADLVFPKDVGYDCPALVLRIRGPKTARFCIIQVAERLFVDCLWVPSFFPAR